MSLIPINDYLLVEHIEDQWAGGVDPEEGIRQGLVVDISNFLAYWGSHTYYFDSSAMNEEMLQKVHDKYKMLVGKIVYWPQLSESGAIIEHDGKKYIFMKFASIMGFEDEQ
jgi:co-chaperonin GroES (HSP10)